MTLRLFTPSLRILWASIMTALVAMEIVPLPSPIVPPIKFYIYCGVKFVLFVSIGYLLPLAFMRFNLLNRGFLIAILSATFVESLQGAIRRGHSFHWYELGLKLVTIMGGFALALEARYDHRIPLGRSLKIILFEEEPRAARSHATSV